MANRPAILNLDTLVVRPLVTIDGTDYEMLNPGELSILDLHRFGALGSEFQSITDSAEKDADLTDAQVVQVGATLDRMVRMILRAPDEVLNRLTDVHKYRIVECFSSLTPSRLPESRVSTDAGAGAAEPEPVPSTGEKS